MEASHLGDATGVITHGTIGINSQSCGEIGQHATGGQRDAIHVRDLKGDIDKARENEDGDDAGTVAKRETVDDIGGSASLARVNKLHDRTELLGGVVFGNEPDDEPTNHSEDHTDEG
jgi:hypothetical protein